MSNPAYLKLQLEAARKQYATWEDRHEKLVKETELAERQMNHWDDREQALLSELGEK